VRYVKDGFLIKKEYKIKMVEKITYKKQLFALVIRSKKL